MRECLPSTAAEVGPQPVTPKAGGFGQEGLNALPRLRALTDIGQPGDAVVNHRRVDPGAQRAGKGFGGGNSAGAVVR